MLNSDLNIENVVTLKMLANACNLNTKGAEAGEINVSRNEKVIKCCILFVHTKNGPKSRARLPYLSIDMSLMGKVCSCVCVMNFDVEV